MGYATGDTQKGPNYFDSTWIFSKVIANYSLLPQLAICVFVCYIYIIIFILQFSVVDVEPPQESGANDKQNVSVHGSIRNSATLIEYVKTPRFQYYALLSR